MLSSASLSAWQHTPLSWQFQRYALSTVGMLSDQHNGSKNMDNKNMFADCLYHAPNRCLYV